MKYQYYEKNLNLTAIVTIRKQKNIILHFKPRLLVITSPVFLKEEKIKKYLYLYQDKLNVETENDDDSLYLHFWGKKYILKVYFSNHNSYYFTTDTINILSTSKSEKDIKKFIKKIYINELRQKADLKFINIKELLNNNEEYKYATTLVKELNYTYAKSFLGRCFKKTNKIELSGYLAKYDEKFIEGVIFHELTHLLVFSHNQLFHRYLASVYPYQARDKKEMRKLALYLEKDYV